VISILQAVPFVLPKVISADWAVGTSETGLVTLIPNLCSYPHDSLRPYQVSAQTPDPFITFTIRQPKSGTVLWIINNLTLNSMTEGMEQRYCK
jgi:hypothetical protein